MNSSLPDIGDVATTQIGGLEIRLARGGRSDGIPILLTRKPALFESVVAGGGGTSPELAGAGLKELIESPAGAFANVAQWVRTGYRSV
jgi:hypothetical protein